MARTRIPPRPAPAPAVPADVRLMNGVSTAIFALAALTLLAAGVRWLTRTPLFTLRVIQLETLPQRSPVEALRHLALPKLEGNFFAVDLRAAQAAFETVPWVRHAVVRRVWPDRLAVSLEEHQPVALWQRDDEAPQLVNSHGELFEANLGEVDEDSLPVFSGPVDSAPQMWAMYRRLQPVLAAQAMPPQRLTLSGRGSWGVETAAGQTLALGRGSDDEVLARTAVFVRTVDQVTGRYGKPLVSADLRHTGGYALRLQGVTTVAAGEAAARGN
jgi:cell division protein FtsQ